MKTPIAPVICAIAVIAAPLRASLSQGEIPDALRAAFVQVQLFSQSAEGETPPRALAEDLRTERPTITAGYLVAPDLVIAPDFNTPPRFVRKWTVRHDKTHTAARPIAWAADRNAMLLKLSKPFPNARPLEFAPAEDTTLSSCFSVKYTADISRRTIIESLSQSRWHVSDHDERTRPVPANSIIATDDGTPVALALTDALPAADTWKTPWRSWPWIYEDDCKARLETLSATAAGALIHADIKLRPLPVRAGENAFTMSTRAADDPSARPQPAIVLAPTRVLVLAMLDPAQTARLENVTLRLPGNATVNARFVASVAAHGAFVVEPEHPIDTPLALPAARPDWIALRDHLLLTIDLRLQGETRLACAGITRILSVGYGVRAVMGPSFTTPKPADPGNTLFLFDLDGNFLGCPLRPRFTDTGAGIGSASQSNRAQIIAASSLIAYTRGLRGWADTNNVPRDEAGERQLVWLGVDLQPLTRELARAQGVAEQTQNGTNGGLVTKVYPDSPAGRCGLQPGDVLLRMRRASSSRNISIRADSSNAFAMQMLTRANQQIPENMYDRLPPPWPVADSPLNRKLKEIGAGKPLALDYARDGEFSTVRFIAEEGPEYYGTAPESIFANCGLNVKALTFETRSFYKIPDDKSALIVSRVVAGSRASVAGLRPYDLIIEVNDQPVTTPAAFSEAAKIGGKLRLLTRRMSQTRIVMLDIASDDDQSSPAPAP
jgi:hypothetical protein